MRRRGKGGHLLPKPTGPFTLGWAGLNELSWAPSVCMQEVLGWRTAIDSAQP